MRRINLLPWRENLRQERQKRFGRQTMALVAGLLLLLALAYMQLQGEMREQARRNQYLQGQINQLQTEINRNQGVLGGAPGEGMKLLSGMQSQRELLVKLLDELPRRIPDGVVLTELRQEGGSFQLSGEADSNATVSELLRQLEASTLFPAANLSLIKAGEAASGRAQSRFTIKLETGLKGGK